LVGFVVGLLVVLTAPREVLTHNPVTTTVRFNREVAGILGQKCVMCHADGTMAMPLTTYAEARPWAEAIKEEILTRRMPPWPVERGYGEFGNGIGLTARELEFLLSWVEGGAPEGDGEPPPVVDHSAHWMLGEPDATVMPRNATAIAADAPPAFSRVVFDTGFRTDAWVRAIDFKPGDRRVARAAFFSVEQTGQYLGGWSPWPASAGLPEDTAFRVPARSRIAVDVLYRGALEPVTERPTLALYVSDRPRTVASSVVMRAPRGAAPSTPGGSTPVRARYTATQPTSLIALRPELTAGMRSLEVRATQPGGSPAVLLFMRTVRLDWQTPLVMREPLALQRGAVVEAIAHYDDPVRERALSVALIVAPASPRPASSR
jgi:hypothetical protein